LAVTVALPLIVTLHISPLALVHPVHEEKVLLPVVAGAVSVTDVPEL
jgi:hypothetical protein